MDLLRFELFILGLQLRIDLLGLFLIILIQRLGHIIENPLLGQFQLLLIQLHNIALPGSLKILLVIDLLADCLSH